MAGKNNTPADALSRPCDNEREVGERQLALLPEDAFLNLAEADVPTSLEGLLTTARQQYQPWFAAQKDKQQWIQEGGQWWDADHKLVVPPNQGVRRRLMHAYHDGLTAHPGRDETVR